MSNFAKIMKGRPEGGVYSLQPAKPAVMKRGGTPILQPVRADLMKLGGTATLQEEADEEGIMSKLTNLWSALTSNEHLPKRFRQFIKAHGRDKIQSLAMMRAPVAKPGVMAMQLLTLGKWDEFKKRGGVDEVYHTSIIVNGNIVLEKLDKVEGRIDAGYSKMEGAELYPIPVKGDITIADFLEKGRRQMGEKFYTYDAFRSNCQDWVANMVSANGLLTAEGRKWIKQDIDKLIKELPELTKTAAVKITDVARDVGNVAEEFIYKNGGIAKPISFASLPRLDLSNVGYGRLQPPPPGKTAEEFMAMARASARGGYARF